MKTPKPWGEEELIVQTEQYVVKKLTMNAGHACSLQFHVRKHETVIVHVGMLELELGTSSEELTRLTLGPGEVVVIPPGAIHRMSAVGQDCVYFEASTIELDDVVRLKDNYGRT